MTDYKKPYLMLFHGITDAIDQLDALNYGYARELLVKALLAAEEQYLNDTDEPEHP